MTTVIANSHAITQPMRALSSAQFSPGRSSPGGGGKHVRMVSGTPVTSFGSRRQGKHAGGTTAASEIRDRQAVSPGLGYAHGRHARLQ